VHNQSPLRKELLLSFTKGGTTAVEGTVRSIALQSNAGAVESEGDNRHNRFFR
jgi:hypothetical protein